MFDPLTAAAAVNLISLVLTKAGDKLVDKASDKLLAKGGEIFDVVKDRFTNDEFAGLTLLRLEENPDSSIRKDAVQGVIQEKAQTDEEFAARLLQLINQAKEIEPSIVVASGDRSIAIGGDVSSSNINTGDSLKPS